MTDQDRHSLLENYAAWRVYDLLLRLWGTIIGRGDEHVPGICSPGVIRIEVLAAPRAANRRKQ